MMETEIEVLEEVELEDAILIEGLPGIGNVGRIAVEYLVQKLDAKKIAELHSPHFMPFVLLHDDEVNMMNLDFYHWKNSDGKDIVFLTGDTQSSDDSVGHYEISDTIIDYCKDIGVSRVITLGGFKSGDADEEMEGENEILGAVTDSELIEEYDDYGINFEDTSSKIGMIVGATGLLLSTAKRKDLDGVALMAETAGFPIVTDPKAAEALLKVLKEMYNIEVSLEEIDEKVEDMKGFLKKVEKIRKKASNQMKSGDDSKSDKLRYIG